MVFLLLEEKILTADFAAGDHFKVKLSACPATLEDNQQSVCFFVEGIFSV